MTSDVLENQILRIHFVDVWDQCEIFELHSIRIKDPSEYAKIVCKQINDKHERMLEKGIPLVHFKN